jgi:hypothetical protein
MTRTITRTSYEPQSTVGVIVHLILTALTTGLWIIPWVIIRAMTRRAVHTTDVINVGGGQ